MMNIFLHQLDIRINSFMEREKSVRYLRYADDMLFAIKSGVDSEQINHSLKKFFNEVLHELKLEATSLELIRGKSKPRERFFLGLFLSIKLSGTLVIRAPFNKWKKKLTLPFLIDRMGKKNKTLSFFLTTLFTMIRVYVAYAFCRSSYRAEQDTIRFFRHLFYARAKDFIKAYRPKDYSLKEKLIPIYVNRLPLLIKKGLSKTDASKGHLFIEGKIESRSTLGSNWRPCNRWRNKGILRRTYVWSIYLFGISFKNKRQAWTTELVSVK